MLERYSLAIHSKEIKSQVYTRHPFGTRCDIDEIHTLPSQGPTLIYEPASHREYDSGFSTTARRLIILESGPKGDHHTNDRVVLNSKTGLWVNVHKPVAERVIDQVVADLQSLHDARGCNGSTKIQQTKYRYEEVCTWLSNEDAASVLARIPHLIKYAEDGDWALDPYSEESWLLVRNLRFPALYPTSSDRFKEPVYFDVKLYVTNSKQPKKLEFQVSLGKDEWKSEQIWSNVIRPTAIQVMIAFLRSCGVISTFIFPSQADRVTSIDAIEPDDDIISEFRNLEYRFDRSPPAQMPRTIYLDLEKGHKESFNEGERKTISALFEHERGWYKFHDGFLSELRSRPKKVTQGHRDQVTARVEELKLTRERLMTRVASLGVKPTQVRSAIKRLIRMGILSERTCGHKRYVRVENVAFMYYTLVTDPGWSEDQD